MKQILKQYSLLDKFNVSRETYMDFEKFIDMLIKKNDKINIISKKSAKNDIIRKRHIIDSAQAIEFVDFNCNTTCDLGTGGGMPGIIIAIIIKNLKKKMKIKLYEKSYHKSNFLRQASEKLNLNVEIFQKDIFQEKNLVSDIIVARAFKPVTVILELIESNFKSFKEIILFLGKNGKELLDDALTKWQFDYKERKSLTSVDSTILKIQNLKKKK